MKVFKRRLAAVLAAVLMVPAQPVMAEPLPVETGQKEGFLTASDSNAASDTGVEKPSEKLTVATSSNAVVKIPSEEVIFNTGNHGFHVVSHDDFVNKELGDAFFEEDGSYTIHIPEENPFFPYEVQFTHKGKVTTEWFMTPDDSVEVGGHTFYVSAYFDGSAVTQMSLEIAGDTVVVYPEKKTFTNGDGAMTMSLLPLKERRLDVDVSDYTPAELTMVSLKSIFAGEQELKDTDQVIWTHERNNSYRVNSSEDTVDLSYWTSDGSQETWEMIVGESDQLASSNVRYFVTLNVQMSEDWLIPTVSKLDEKGNRVNVSVISSQYDDNISSNDKNDIIFRDLDFDVPSDEVAYGEDVYIGFKINPSVFDNPKYSQVKVYQGGHALEYLPVEGEDITDLIYDVDVMKENSGYLFSRDQDYEEYISIVTFDADGKITGNLPVHLSMSRTGSSIHRSLNDKPENGGGSVWQRSHSEYRDGCNYISYELKQNFPKNGLYYFKMSYRNAYGDLDNSKVTAAYIGKYESISKANEAGAKNIKEDLFRDSGAGGYVADYSEGVYFTFFIGEDGAKGQEKYCYCIKTIDAIIIPGAPSSSTSVDFHGLVDPDENQVKCVIVDKNSDSYGEKNYLTILVDEDVDLTSLAPIFSIQEKSNLYASGSSSPEISGKSFHDFSNGPVQYTVAAENKENSKNYWLQVIKATSGENKLCINSLNDGNAETRTEGDVTYSTREILLDGLHSYRHDILLINMAKEEIDALSVELESDQVELDDYWTLKGKHGLAGFSLASENQGNKHQNMAKIRITALDYVEAGTDVSGTLTIKSGDMVLMVLTLTGTVGDPSIVTKEIPQAVKYVPYGTMIQNSNKYSWNRISYNLKRGKLPSGMELRPNGEIYGVPTETGEFTFTVIMKNSENSFSSSEREFTLVVNENTDANVEAATDQGYYLTQRVQDISLTSSADQTVVSEGVYAEFVNLFLDGVKLQEGIDYDSESGSTRITIRSQTLKSSKKTGTHTLGIEFRTKDTNDLKRAAQNYKVSGGENSDHDSNNNGGGRSSNATNRITLTKDPKKGFMDPQKGIITGVGEGYSHWMQDEHGWKLIYTDGTAAAGFRTVGPDGATAEQVAWEKVNGFWYAFGVNEYLKSGWIYDYQLRHWYYMSAENGMKSGWLDETQDGCTYYLEPENGQIVTGWRQIDGKWYYFSEALAAPTWHYDENTGNWLYNKNSKIKPFGAMYRDEITPDGYLMGVDGAWDGIEK